MVGKKDATSIKKVHLFLRFTGFYALLSVRLYGFLLGVAKLSKKDWSLIARLVPRHVRSGTRGCGFESSYFE